MVPTRTKSKPGGGYSRSAWRNERHRDPGVLTKGPTPETSRVHSTGRRIGREGPAACCQPGHCCVQGDGPVEADDAP
jgi:hypothetical protein